MGRILHGDHKAALFHLVTWGGCMTCVYQG